MLATTSVTTAPTNEQTDPRPLAAPDKLELLVLAGILLLGLALRIHGLGAKSLWLDELVLARSAYGDGTLFGPFGFGAVVHPPGYLMLIRLVEQFVGRSDMLVRLPAALFSLGGILAIWALGRSLAGPAVALTAAFVLAISAFHVQYGQELHTYALFATLSTVLLWSLLRAVQRSVAAADEKASTAERAVRARPSIQAWLTIWWPFALTAVLALYSHYYAVFTMALTALMLLIFLLMESGRPLSALWRERGLRAVLLGYAAAMAVVGVLFVPQAIFGLRNSMDYANFRVQSVAAGELARRFELGPHLAAETFISFVTGRASGIGESALLLLLLATFFLLGFVWMLAQPAGPVRRRYRLLALAVIVWVALPLPVIAWLSQRAGESFAARRLIFAFPMIVLVESIGLVGVAALIGRWGVGGAAGIADPRSRPAWPMIILLLGLTTVAGISTLRSYYDRPKQDYRAAAQLLQAHVGQQDAVAALGSLTRANLAWYYSDPITDLSRNVVSTLENLCEQHEAIFLVGVPPSDRYPETSAGWISQNFAAVEFYQISVYYRNCQPDAWYGDGAEEIFRSALGSGLSAPWTRRSHEHFAALVANRYLTNGQAPESALDELQRQLAPSADATSPARQEPAAQRNRAEQMLRDGAADDALAIFQQLAARNPLDRASRMGVANALIALQRFDAAMVELESINAQWPEFPFSRVRQGALLEQQGDMAAAIAAYEAAVQVAPDNADARFTLAFAYRHAGLIEQAMAAFEAGLAIDPERSAARAVLETLKGEE